MTKLRSADLLPVLLCLLGSATLEAQDPLRTLQEDAVATRDEEVERVVWFGDQDRKGVFSTSTYHSNRLVPAVLFSGIPGMPTLDAYRSVDPYRRGEDGQPARVDHLDQTQLHTVLVDAVERGAKRVVVLLLDGCDWQTYAAASTAAYGTWDPDGYGAGLAWFAEVPEGATRSYAAVITSPLRGVRRPGGYDPEAGGRFPWSTQDLRYLKGEDPRNPRTDGGPTPDPVTDSASSATSIFTGYKTTNGRINTLPGEVRIDPLGRMLQRRGFAVATVTDVPFDHASPAAVYAAAASRNEYAETLGPQMVGLREWPGPDVVLGYGYDHPRDRYLSDDDLEAVQRAGRFEVVTSGGAGDDPDRIRLAFAARQVAARRAEGHLPRSRLFGFFGTPELDHAPFRTADGGYDPTPGIGRGGDAAAPESYGPRERNDLPRLVDMAEAAMTVLGATPERPFLLFCEAGLVDWALHANNVDHAVGEVLSAEETFEALTAWITRNGWWGETVLLVTSDHGHLMNVDLQALQTRMRGGR